MIIYDITQWVDPAKNKEWYSLRVLSQWDFTKPVCFEERSNRDPIVFSLRKNTIINNTSYESVIVTNLSQEMKDELVSMGYSLLNRIQ